VGGGQPVDIWRHSLIFNQENNYQLKKEKIDCAAGHAVDWLVIDYMYFKFERDMALPTEYGPLWRLPTGGSELGCHRMHLAVWLRAHCVCQTHA
jgi:hypothetical protein